MWCPHLVHWGDAIGLAANSLSCAQEPEETTQREAPARPAAPCLRMALKHFSVATGSKPKRSEPPLRKPEATFHKQARSDPERASAMSPSEHWG